MTRTVIEALETALDTEENFIHGGESKSPFEGYYNNRLAIAHAQQDVIDCAAEMRKQLKRLTKLKGQWGNPLRDLRFGEAVEFYDGAVKRLKFLQDESTYE